MKISFNATNDMNVMNYKSQAAMYNAMQKVGRGKRKVSVLLDKSAQKFLETFMKEFKKTFEQNASLNQVKNILSFAEYVLKTVSVEKGKKRAKVLPLLISYEEQDFLCMQLQESIKGVIQTKKDLKWYNFIKKIMFASYKTQCESMYDVIKKATK